MINDTVFAELFYESEKRKKESEGYRKKRFLFEELKKAKNVFKGIYGLRGTGKTTLLLQLARETDNSMYINTEELVLRNISIMEFVEFAAKKGFLQFFIDEIQTHPSWPHELKLLYDRGIHQIIFSGSSSLRIQEEAADLSRRALLFYLPPLSFREFLELAANTKLDRMTFEDVLDFEKRKGLISQLAPYMSYFDEYMKLGSFPFYLTEKENAYPLYKRIVEKIVRIDLAAVGKIDVNYVENIYKILNTLAVSSPSAVSYNFLARQIHSSVYTIEQIMNNLVDVGLVYAIPPASRSAASIRKEYKFLLSPPFRLVLAKNVGLNFEQVIGGIREDLFVANTLHLKAGYIKTERERKTPDYLLHGVRFELGPHKYKDDTDFYVKDQLIMDENAIPLPLFCMFI